MAHPQRRRGQVHEPRARRVTSCNVLAWDGLTLAAPEPAANCSSWPRQPGRGAREGGRARAPTGLHADAELQPERPGMPEASTTECRTRPSSMLPPELVDTRRSPPSWWRASGPEMGAADVAAGVGPADPADRPPPTVSSTRSSGTGLEFQTFGVDGDSVRRRLDRPTRCKLGTAEEWTVVNGPDDKLTEHAHVFHIHVNPFKVTKINGTAARHAAVARHVHPDGERRATRSRSRSNFVDFTGRFVDHCHVADPRGSRDDGDH